MQIATDACVLVRRLYEKARGDEAPLMVARCFFSEDESPVSLASDPCKSVLIRELIRGFWDCV